jgi:hypothetical protein
MTRKLTILSLAAILVIAIAVPAFGAGAPVTPQVTQELSVRALAKARLALLTARSAKSQSRVAVRTAEAAVNTSNDAVKSAGEAKSAAAATQAILNLTHIQSALAAGAATTESEKFEQLPGGPSLSVDVPSSGLLEVWAQVRFSGEGAVALFEDGQLMAGQAENCGFEEVEPALLSSQIPVPITLATPSTPPFASPFCGVEGPPAGVLFQTTPGKHTYELRYTIGCGCEPEATFSKRLLRVAPRL